MKRVLLDVDGVLADFLTKALEVINDAGSHNFSHEHVTDFNICEVLGVPHMWENVRNACSQEGFVMNLNPMFGAHQGVESLRKHAELYCVTSPMSVPNWAFERERWLEKHFNIKKSHVVHTEAKHVVLGDYIIDDKIQNVESWASHHPKGVGIIFDAPYNRNHVSTLGNVVRASDWIDVVSFVAEHASSKEK